MENWLYPNSVQEAKEAQKQMAEKVCFQDDFPDLQRIGGMDVSHKLYDPNHLIYASTVVLDFKTLSVVEHASVEEKQTFPYIPGFLGFREAPALVHSFQKLKIKPDLLVIDGQGISHPRRLGIASQIGVILDIPTIGVAKSILVGQPDKALGTKAGSETFLVWKGEEIGILFRSKKGANPLIISSGHKISLASAVKLIKQCFMGYKMPEPTRQAHLTSNDYRKCQSAPFKQNTSSSIK